MKLHRTIYAKNAKLGTGRVQKKNEFRVLHTGATEFTKGRMLYPILKLIFSKTESYQEILLFTISFFLTPCIIVKSHIWDINSIPNIRVVCYFIRNLK